MAVPKTVGTVKEAGGDSSVLRGVHATAGEFALAAQQRTREQVLLGSGAILGGVRGGDVTPITLDSLALNPALAFQVELLNLGAELEASGFLDFARGDGMAGPCGWGGSNGSGTSSEILKNLMNPAGMPGKTGYAGERVNSIWSALNRSLFRARTFGQTSDQSTPEVDDPLFRNSRNLPRALSLRKLRKQ